MKTHRPLARRARADEALYQPRRILAAVDQVRLEVAPVGVEDTRTNTENLENAAHRACSISPSPPPVSGAA